MSLSVTQATLGSSYPLAVATSGGNATTVAVTGGTVYYGPDNTVSSSNNSGNITTGNSATFTSTTWVISASTSALVITDYPGGGDLESEYATWEPVHRQQGVPMVDGTAAGTYICTGALNTFVAVAATDSGQGQFYLDPAQYPGGAGVRTPKIRLRSYVTTNAVAPACTNLVYGLYPVATVGGTATNGPTIATLGTRVTSVTIGTPLATTRTVGTSSSVAFPAAGWYVLGVVVGTGGTAATALTTHGFELQTQRTAP